MVRLVKGLRERNGDEWWTVQPLGGGSPRTVMLRAVYDGARGFDAAVELPAITVAGKALDAGAAEFVPGS